jgi:lipopolysaccharide transport system ATP-binding protein
MDRDPEWQKRPRPVGRFVSTAWIPGNFLAEGTVLVHAVLYTFEPLRRHFKERHAVAFEVIDSLDGDSARGDYAGSWEGVVRPVLEWTTQFSEAEEETASARADR